MQELPFLEGSLKSLGLLNHRPVSEIMAKPVTTINEITRVGDVYRILSETHHNAYPVLNKDGHLRGLILRKALCSLLKYKTFSFPVTASTRFNSEDIASGRLPSTAGTQLTSASTMFYDTMERHYPNYPTIEDIKLLPAEMVSGG